MDRIGVIGLGRMGKPIAERLLAAGFEVTGTDLQLEPLEELKAKGLRTAPCGRAVARHSDIIAISVGFDEEVKDVVLGSDGILRGAAPGSVILILSTTSPGTVIDLAEEARKHGVHLLDAPMCRGEKAAADGTILYLVGGDRKVFERCRPFFAATGKDYYLVGRAGAGEVAKCINNLLLWAAKVSNFEGLSLASLYGLDIPVLRQALIQSSGNNWSLENLQNFSTMPWDEKDMKIVLSMAKEKGISLPLCDLVKQLVEDPRVRDLNSMGKLPGGIKAVN